MRVLPLLRAFTRWQDYRVLPAAGGIDDQEERLLQAFDVFRDVLIRGEEMDAAAKSRRRSR